VRPGSGTVARVTATGWAELLTLLATVGFGVLSAVIPFANAEAYVFTSQVSHSIDPVPVALGIAVGQTVGKVLLFYGVRRGKNLPGVRHRRAALRSQPAGPVRARLRTALQTLLALVGQKRWGLPTTFVAAVVGVPPLYAVALLAGATRMRLVWFAAVVLAGRVLRFGLVAYGVGGVGPWATG
jgi:membrane protein YqaA with SNARE-associated domain